MVMQHTIPYLGYCCLCKKLCHVRIHDINSRIWGRTVSFWSVCCGDAVLETPESLNRVYDVEELWPISVDMDFSEQVAAPVSASF